MDCCYCYRNLLYKVLPKQFKAFGIHFLKENFQAFMTSDSNSNSHDLDSDPQDSHSWELGNKILSVLILSLNFRKIGAFLFQFFLHFWTQSFQQDDFPIAIY